MTTANVARVALFNPYDVSVNYLTCSVRSQSNDVLNFQQLFTVKLRFCLSFFKSTVTCLVHKKILSNTIIRQQIHKSSKLFDNDSSFRFQQVHPRDLKSLRHFFRQQFTYSHWMTSHVLLETILSFPRENETL